MMSRYAWVGIAAMLAGMPAAGQQIIQRMERDVQAETKAHETLEKAPQLGLEDLRKIALAGRSVKGLRSDENGMLRRVALRLRQGEYALARKDWESTLGKLKERKLEPDVDSLVNAVLNQASFQEDTEVQRLVGAVKFREEQRTAAYEEKAGLERLKAVFDGGKTPNDLSIRALTLPEKYETGVRPVERAEAKPATAESVAAEQRKIVALCNRADDNAQKSVADLDKALQAQTETWQTVSNMSKMMHDIAKPIINNLKG